MNLTDTARLSLLALLILLLQLALILGLPGWRTGFELYAPFLLLVSASRGPVLAGVYALAGGAVMDAFSDQYVVFHILFYLIPVALGSLVRAHVLTEYRLLGAVTTVSMMIAKVALMLIAGLVMGWIPSGAYLFKANYLPIFVVGAIVYSFWNAITRLFGVAEVRSIG